MSFVRNEIFHLIKCIRHVFVYLTSVYQPFHIFLLIAIYNAMILYLKNTLIYKNLFYLLLNRMKLYWLPSLFLSNPEKHRPYTSSKIISTVHFLRNKFFYWSRIMSKIPKSFVAILLTGLMQPNLSANAGSLLSVEVHLKWITGFLFLEWQEFSFKDVQIMHQWLSWTGEIRPITVKELFVRSTLFSMS